MFGPHSLNDDQSNELVDKDRQSSPFNFFELALNDIFLIKCHLKSIIFFNLIKKKINVSVLGNLPSQFESGSRKRY